MFRLLCLVLGPDHGNKNVLRKPESANPLGGGFQTAPAAGACLRTLRPYTEAVVMGEGGCQGDSALDITSWSCPLLSHIHLLSESRRRKAAGSERLGCRFLLRLSFQGGVWAVSVYSLYAFSRLNFFSEVSSEKRIQLVY